MDQTRDENHDPELSAERLSAERLAAERYVTGRMAEDEAAAFEERYLLDPQLAAVVADAQRLRRGLEVIAAQEAAGAALAVGLWQRWRRSRALRWGLPLVLVASLALPLVIQVQRANRLQADLDAARQPRVNTPIVELAATRGATSEHLLLTLPAGQDEVVLALEVPAANPGRERGPEYRVELTGSDGQQLWQGQGLVADGAGRLVLILPRRLLPAGDTVLQVSRQAEQAEVPVARFELRIAARP